MLRILNKSVSLNPSRLASRPASPLQLAAGPILTAVALAAGSMQAGAALIAYEGFNYTPTSTSTTNLVGENGGTGWNGAWGAHQNNPASAPSISSTGLSYTGLPSEGGSITPGGYQSARRSFTTTDFSTGTFYISYLVQPTSNTADLGIRLSPTTTDPNPDFRTAFGIVNGAVTITNGWGNDPKLNTDNTTVALNQTHLLVAKINLDSETISLFLNPTAGAAEPGTASASYQWTNETNRLSSIGMLTAGAIPGNGGMLDEIRVGNSFADVTAVPEPSSAALLAFGVLGLMRRRR